MIGDSSYRVDDEVLYIFCGSNCGIHLTKEIYSWKKEAVAVINEELFELIKVQD